MPVEIRELIICARINNDDNSGSGEGITSEQKEDIIAECIQQVLKILERKKER